MQKGIEHTDISKLIYFDNHQAQLHLKFDSTVKIDLEDVTNVRLGELDDDYVSIVLEKRARGHFKQHIYTHHPDRHRIPDILNQYISGK